MIPHLILLNLDHVSTAGGHIAAMQQLSMNFIVDNRKDVVRVDLHMS